MAVSAGERLGVQLGMNALRTPGSRPTEDESTLLAAVANNPEDDRALVSLGVALWNRSSRTGSRSEREAAIDAFRRAAQQNPGNEAALANLGTALGAVEAETADPAVLDEAVTTLRGVLELNPHNGTVLENLGDLLERRYALSGDSRTLEEAINALRAAAQITPNSDAALTNLGRLLERRYALSGDSRTLKEAINVFRRAVDINPGNAAAFAKIALLRPAEPADADVPGVAPRDRHDESPRSGAYFGEPVRVIEASYRNPLEIVLGGAGFLLMGATVVLRIARDWSNARRSGAAAATIEESAARRSATYADLAEWLVNEVMEGRIDMPPGDLISIINQPELQAIDRLAERKVQLELPSETGHGH